LSKLGIPAPPAIDYLIAFVVIFVLLALAALVLRRLTGGRLALPGQERGRTRQPRLGVVDVYDLDRQRQLILLRRDNVEHLLLIGGPNDVVIETNIVRVAGARLPAPAGEATLERIEPAPERIGEATAAQPIEPTRPAAPVAARLGAVPAGPPNGGAEARPARGARPPAPSARVEPALKPDTVALAPEPGAAGPELQGEKELEPGALGQAQARALTAPGPAPARRAPQPPPAARLRPVEAEPRPAPARPAAPTPALHPAPSEPAAADAAVLTDMARQLEEALRQPRPAQKASEATAPAQDEPFAPPAPAPGPPPQASAPPSAPLPSPHPAQPRPAERPVPPKPLRAEPAAEPAAAPSQAAPPAPPAPAPPASRGDPFSVEEIEAEFARLLGRPLDKNEKG